MTSQTQEPLKGYALALSGAFFLGTAGLIGRMIYRYEPNPLTVATIRSAIATILLFLGLALFRRDLLRLKPKDLRFFTLYGLAGMAGIPVCFLSAIKYTTVATASILLGSAPVFVVLVAALLFREPLNRYKLLSLGLTCGGTALVMQCYRPQLFSLNLTGVLFGIGACVCMTFFILLGRRATVSYHVWTMVFYGMLCGTGFLLLFHSLSAQAEWRFDYPPQIWGWFLLHALLPMIFADICYMQSLRYLEAGKVSIVVPFQVVVASGLAFFFLGEGLEALQLLGGGLVLSGIVLVQWVSCRAENAQPILPRIPGRGLTPARIDMGPATEQISFLPNGFLFSSLRPSTARGFRNPTA